MPRQIYRQPSPRRRDEDEQSFGKPNGFSTPASPRGADISRGASDTLGNIDSVLGDVNASRQGISNAEARAAKQRRVGAAQLRGARQDRNNSTAKNLASPLSGNQLADAEQNAGNRKNEITDNLYRGFDGKTDENGKKIKKTLVSRLYNSNSGLKKRIAIAGAAMGGSLLAGAVIFMLMLPLKIGHIIKNLDGKFSAVSNSAMQKESDKLLNRYLASSVIPSILKNECASTIDLSCKVSPAGSGPFKSLYNSWKETRLEYKMATNPDNPVVIGKKGGKFYVNINHVEVGTPGQLRKLQLGQISLFDLDGTDQVSRNDIRRIVHASLDDATLWKRVYGRHIRGKYLEQKFGIKRCVFACEARDNLTDKFVDAYLAKKISAKVFLVQHMLPDKYGIILTCIIGGAIDECDSTKLSQAEPGDKEKLTPFQKQLDKQLASLAGKIGKESADELIKSAETLSKDIQENGLQKVVARKAISAIVGKFAGETTGEAAGAASEKAIPIVGWVILAAQILALEPTVGPLLQHAAYAMNVASSVEIYEAYATIWAECQSGHCNSQVFGDINNALSTSISGNASKSVDFTESPLWQKEFNGVTATNTAYRCDDDKPVPTGKTVCDEENFAQDGNKLLTELSSRSGQNVPLQFVAGWISRIANLPGEALGKLLDKLPGFESLSAWIGKNMSGALTWVMKQLVTTPDIDSGARQIDMMMAGADAVGNTTCQVLLGCAQITGAQASAIQNQQLNQEKIAFESLPFTERMFSTTSRYSMLSQLAVNMPSTWSTFSADVVGVLTNPFHTVGTVFSNLLSGKDVFAASTTEADPFGIPQTGYLDSQIPSDPETYWEQNCVQADSPLGTYDEATQTLDIHNWLNSQTMDEDTGQALASTVNPCLLTLTTIQSLGGLGDPSLLPSGSTNQDPVQT